MTYFSKQNFHLANSLCKSQLNQSRTTKSMIHKCQCKSHLISSPEHSCSLQTHRFLHRNIYCSNQQVLYVWCVLFYNLPFTFSASTLETKLQVKVRHAAYRNIPFQQFRSKVSLLGDLTGTWSAVERWTGKMKTKSRRVHLQQLLFVAEHHLSTVAAT